MSGGNWKQLFKAVTEGDFELVSVYLKTGIDPNYQHPEFMEAPLVESIRCNHLDIAELLLKNGAEPNIKEVWGGATPLSVAENKNNQEAIELLKKYMTTID